MKAIGAKSLTLGQHVMARIQRLPFDIVHIVLAYLATADLPAVALVCHSFSAVATPRIYAALRYSSYLAKHYRKIVCPFELLVARPDLLAFVKALDIRALPLFKGAPHPQFTRDCLHVVARAPSLASFAWNTSSPLLSVILPLLAPVGPAPHGRPSLVRLSITDDALLHGDAQLISRLGPVEQITFNKPSTAAIKALVDWMAPSSDSDIPNSRVQSLTLSGAHALQPDALARILGHTPSLRTLGVTDCVHVPHTALFSVLLQTQVAVESLSFTISSDWDDATFPPLVTLRHISITINPPEEPIPDRYTNVPTDPLTQRLLRNLFTALPTALDSMTIRLSSHRTLTDKLVKLLIAQHGSTLRRLNLFRLALSAAAVAAILRRLPNLEQLSAELPWDQIETLLEALPAASHLHTLVDTAPPPTAARAQSRRPGPKPAPNRGLTRAQAAQLIQAGPVLASVMSQGRNWAKEYQWTAGRCETVVSMRRIRMAGH